MTDAHSPAPGAVCVPFAQALRFWARLGCISFGGPAAQIALMREELVVRRGWLPAQRFDHALNFCMLLPGPEAQQLATYSGWLLHGTRGGLAAGLLFVLPAALLLFALSWLYAVWGQLRAVDGVLWGCKAVVVALVLDAVLRLGRRALRRPAHWFLAGGAFAALQWFAVPFPWVVAGAAAFGTCLPVAPAGTGDGGPPPPREGSLRRTFLVLAIGLCAWAAPLLLLRGLGTPVALAAEQYLFFSGAALVTFGGAYAVLAYVSQAAVDSFGWITSVQAIDGLALAESTPGPLIMVLQFVGFMTGWNHPGELSRLTAATLGAVVTTWATFLPSMLFIFLGAPWVEALRRVRAAQRALAGVTAAVIGVIVNIGVVFGTAVVWPVGRDGGRSFDALALLLALAIFTALATRRLGVLAAVAVGAGLGLLRCLF
jgi:chromate transporter